MGKTAWTKNIRADNHFVFRERYDYGPFPIAYYYLDFFGIRCLKYYGAHITRAMHCAVGAYENGRSKAILGYKDEWLEFCRSVLEKILDDKDFVRRTNDRAQAAARDYNYFSRRLLAGDCFNNSFREQVANHKKWIRLYREYSFWNCFLWLSANDILVDYISGFLEKDYNLEKSDILTLITSPRPSFTSREEKSLLKIALQANLDKGFSEQPKAVKRLFDKHAKYWGFIPWDYIGPIFWQAEDFYQRAIAISNNKKTIRKALAEKEGYYKALIKKQNFLMKRHRIKTSHRRLIRDLWMVSSMQDDKKEVCGLAQFALQRSIFPYFAKVLGITARDCIKFSEEELWKAYRKKKSLRKALAKRLQAITSITDIRGTHLLTGKRAAAVYKRFNFVIKKDNISGAAASIGRVRGRVRIALSPKEIDGVRKGDILVVIMTTPDYIPAMKLAAAIITDEGGLTSHAAIISRELKIPCIVGTKNATKILKNGDLVEVDAGKGIVRIIK